ncbi:MAG: RloB family protein [Prevotellaceae bacterium]|jgi:hypothetical protein|nr:RloB family protein [Prevotellaceae bacterium]
MMRQNKLGGKNQSFAFIVDGECEYLYIQMLQQNEKGIKIALKPKILQKKKLSEQYKLVTELVNSKNYDKIFWIIDFDVIIEKTREIQRGKKTELQEFKEYYMKINKNDKLKEKIIIIINNPCLEYWFLLHFETTTKYYENCDKVVRQLKKHNQLSDYAKTKDFYTKYRKDIYLRLKPFLNNAIDNANRLNPFDFENVQSGLSQMQLFFETDEIKTMLNN